MVIAELWFLECFLVLSYLRKIFGDHRLCSICLEYDQWTESKFLSILQNITIGMNTTFPESCVIIAIIQ